MQKKQKSVVIDRKILATENGRKQYISQAREILGETRQERIEIPAPQTLSSIPLQSIEGNGESEAEHLSKIIYNLLYALQEQLEEEKDLSEKAHWRSDEAKSKLTERDQANHLPDEETGRGADKEYSKIMPKR